MIGILLLLSNVCLFLHQRHGISFFISHADVTAKLARILCTVHEALNVLLLVKTGQKGLIVCRAQKKGSVFNHNSKSTKARVSLQATHISTDKHRDNILRALAIAYIHGQQFYFLRRLEILKPKPHTR